MKFRLIEDIDLEDIAIQDTEISSDILEGPQTPSENGIATLLIDLINDEWEAIQGYNDFIVNAKAEEHYDDVIKVINDILAEENKHVGQLQAVLKTISDNVNEIDNGVVEGEAQLSSDDDLDEDDMKFITDGMTKIYEGEFE